MLKKRCLPSSKNRKCQFDINKNDTRRLVWTSHTHSLTRNQLNGFIKPQRITIHCEIMTRPRPCGCKGCRTCLICETQYGAENLKLQLELDKSKGYVYCPFCNKAWRGWDLDSYKKHPNHEGDSIDYPGIYIQMNFISEEEERHLMQNIDEVPWDVSQSGRRKQNYGPKTNFKKKKVVLGKFEGFPAFSKYLQERFASIDLLKNYYVIEQCSLEYDPSKGASIDPHIDDCWIWGERIITVNCLSDSVLTMTKFIGDLKKYNLYCAEQYGPVVAKDGSIITDNKMDQSMLEACKSVIADDVIIRIPMPRRSLLIIYGEARYHWEHSVLREDISSRRVCIAYREFTPPYLYGDQQEIGNAIREIGKNFWDHKAKVYETVEDVKQKNEKEIINGHDGLRNDGIKSPVLRLSPLIGQNKKVENQIA